jgi:hypothetical protein
MQIGISRKFVNYRISQDSLSLKSISGIGTKEKKISCETLRHIHIYLINF